MPVSPYINCSGNCREAVAFYADVFHTPMQDILTYGEMPDVTEESLPEESRDLVAHTWLDIHGTMVGFSDHFPVESAVAGNNVGLLVTLTTEDGMAEEFEALAAGGTVEMPLQETFWAKRYGSLTDRYGVSWQFMLESPDDAGSA